MAPPVIVPEVYTSALAQLSGGPSFMVAERQLLAIRWEFLSALNAAADNITGTLQPGCAAVFPFHPHAQAAAALDYMVPDQSRARRLCTEMPKAPKVSTALRRGFPRS